MALPALISVILYMFLLLLLLLLIIFNLPRPHTQTNYVP
jgi:hypothetical protein